jgi:hypothetical protein
LGFLPHQFSGSFPGGLAILMMVSKIQLYVSLIFLVAFIFLFSLISALIFLLLPFLCLVWLYFALEMEL